MDASWAEGCSSSSIPILPQWIYHVFVSFRGADTRKKFTSHLFAALEDNGFRTFRDDKELERGEYISDGLVKAIEGSRISLIVFSKDYAGSRWCLDELVRIMNCRETLKQIVVPIFYDVVPSDVRKQMGVLQLAFAKHERRFREGLDGKVKRWRAALTEAANLSGRHLLNEANGDEAELIKMIIKDVREKVNPTHLNVPDHQVGLELRVAKLNVLLNMESNCVRIVAIWGMGGIGKTTIAKRLYNLIQPKFERSGFLANVRETSQQSNGRDELQKKLLLALLKRTHEVSNFYEGIEVIKKVAFGRKKVLLVLDDVDNVQQLEALAINRDFFAPGSRIIITTRDKSSLKILELGENEIYGPEKLDKDESLELFSWHAFKEVHPPDDYLDLSHQIGHYAGGLPLALEVLGSYFCGESIPQWESAIAKLRKIPDDDVLGKLNMSLKISFDSLSEQLKKLFLDMACFFVGIGRDFTVKILEGYNIYAEDGIRKLFDRCLIKYDRHDQIVMHDMIRDMAREIVRQESFEDPGKRSRLWYLDDVLEVLRDGTGTEAVKGLILNATNVQVNTKPFEKMDRLWYCEHVLGVRRDGMGIEVVEGHLPDFNDPKDVQVNAKAFEKMNNLLLLHLDYVHLTAGYEHISRRLLWLSWKGFPLDCIPWNFSMEKLVALDLRYSSLKKVWNGNMILDKLKFLYLSHCHYLTRTPDFSGLYSLEELLLNDCKSLEEVDESIRCLNKLLVLDMKNCTKLRKLPSGIWMLKSLKHLDLSGCSKLGNLGVFKGPLCKLWCLFFSSGTLPPKGVDSIGFSLTPVPASSCLKELNLKDCHLSYLPDEIGNLISLRTLDLAQNNLNTLPGGICNLTCLKHLRLDNNNVSHLPSGIGRLTSLESLNLERNSLCTLPDTIGTLSCLKELFVGNNKLSHLPSEIGDLDSLKILKLQHNNGFSAFPESICKLIRLRGLSLYDCNLSHLPSGIGGLVSLGSLNIGKNNFCTIPDSISNHPRLETIGLSNCAKLQSLPKLPTCRFVDAVRCPSLESLPLELDQLGQCVDYSESNKLAENNFLTSLLKQLPKSKGLSELQHVVSIVVPARDDEVHTWFPYHDGREPNVSFVVPPSPSVNQKMLGWILRLLLWAPRQAPYQQLHELCIEEVICNKIKREGLLDVLFHFRAGPTDVNLVWLQYMPQGYDGLQLEGGDEVEIPIYANDALVKNWAIDLIYEADEIHKGTDTLYQVVSV
ncbi:disease resistance protein RPV1-like [Rhododendron vialii]|uniref:disease resistance protein RPV1-like n=1 Tax=Rhododendron vialii TaxID=182163 RepID=UPI002660369E|nr:disease resistance protein RPV1-like [Rhododendron vialii]XP_058182399.1 disease resistance protein RPV1-like [Rhododendron vialii]